MAFSRRPGVGDARRGGFRGYGGAGLRADVLSDWAVSNWYTGAGLSVGSATMSVGILAKKSAHAGTAQFLWKAGANLTSGYGIDQTSGGLMRAMIADGTATNRIANNGQVIAAAQIGNWYTFVMVFDGADLWLYVNGVCTANFQTITGYTVGNGTVWIGRYDNTRQPEDWAIAGISITQDAALTPIQVAAWHNSMVASKTATAPPAGTSNYLWSVSATGVGAPATWAGTGGNLTKTGTVAYSRIPFSASSYPYSGLAQATPITTPGSYTAPGSAIVIHPVGDSLTYNSNGNCSGAWRQEAENVLLAAGATIDYVGTLSEGPAGLVDKDNEGHGGFTIQDTIDNISSYMTTADPSGGVTVLWIGHNTVLAAIADHDSAFSAMRRMRELILKVLAHANAPSKVLVGTLLGRNQAYSAAAALHDQNTKVFNDHLLALVKELADLGYPVSVVDIDSVVSDANKVDGLHTNQAGCDQAGTEIAGAIEYLTDSP